MVFDKVKIPNRDNKPIPFKKDPPAPQPKDKLLPFNYFTCLAVGMTGSGKSYSVAKLLKYYADEGLWLDGKRVEQRIIFFAPTFDTNPIYKGLQNIDYDNDVHLKYSDTLLQEVLDDLKTIKEETEKYQAFLQIYKKFLKVKKMTELSAKEIATLNIYDFDIANYPEPRYKTICVNHLIFDDLVGTSAYRATGTSLLTNLAIRCRHYYANCYFLAQTLNSIPKNIRLQQRLQLIYRYNSKNIIQDLYDSVSGVMTEETFKEIYFSVTEEKYHFLCIDNTKQNIEIKENFDYLIKYDKPKRA